MSSSPNAIVSPTIFREYIGVKPYPDNLTDFPTDIINHEIQEFHFILGFAREEYDSNGKGTGNFKRTWNVEYFNAEKIKYLKLNYPNVKVVISIGGRGSQYPFNPAEPMVWIDAAKSSLKEIIQDFKDSCCCHLIDGIDVNYEIIKTSETEFAHCIGKVIQGLKHEHEHIISAQSMIKVVSIAPSYLVRSHYKNLYEGYREYIDWVDYQFYDQTISSKHKFVELYRELSNDYKEKLLAGFSTDPNDQGKISREDFLEGCNDLIKSKLLAGIFVWDANDSAVPPPNPNENPFLFEIKAQNLLTQKD